MKVGYQTISWGRTLTDGGRTLLEAVRAADYDGVEIAQHPDEFGSTSLLYGLLRDSEGGGAGKRKKLRLLGLAGGSVSQRIDLLEELVEVENKDLLAQGGKTDRVIGFDEDHPYIYTDAWDKGQAPDAPAKRWKFALHPHMFKPIQTANEALAMLREYPGLRFLPDTAHLTIAGEDVIKVLEEAFEIPVLDEESGKRVSREFGPVVGVHLKDWASDFGRSYQFYSRGFGVSFGQGEVKLDKIVRFLQDRRYDGWLVVEQDVVDDFVGAIGECRQWLRDRGI